MIKTKKDDYKSHFFQKESGDKMETESKDDKRKLNITETFAFAYWRLFF